MRAECITRSLFSHSLIARIAGLLLEVETLHGKAFLGMLNRGERPQVAA